MIPPATFKLMKSAFLQTVETLGAVPVVWMQNDPPNKTASMSMGIRRTSKNDEEIVNAYAQGVVLATAKAEDFPVPPKKFDRILVEGQDMVINSANPVALNNEIILYKIILRGK